MNHATEQSSRQPEQQPLPVHRLESYGTLFRENPQFRRLWLAGVISQIGNWFNYIAIFVLITKLTGSGTAVSWFLIAKFLPTTFLGPAAGIVADRFSRKRIMIFCDLARILVVLGFLFVQRAEQVWIVYLLALMQESLWSFSDPARRATVPNLCKPWELNLANALSGATWSVMLALGAALGGFVTAFLGWQTAIIIDAATFAASAAILKGLLVPKHTGAEAKKKKLSLLDYVGWNDLKAGCAYVADNGRIRALLLVKSGWAVSGGFLVLLTIFGEQVFTVPGEGGGSGILYSARGIGAAIGPILAWRLLGERKKAMYRAIGYSFFVASAAYLCFSRMESILAAIPFVLLGHMGGSVQWVFSTTLLQRMVPDAFRGRVFAAEMALFTLLLSLSTYFTGLALEIGYGPRTVMTGLALLYMLPGSLWTLYTYSRKPYRPANAENSTMTRRY